MATPPRAIALATQDPIAIVVGTPVQFLDASQGSPNSWIWDFSFDATQAPETGTTSTEQNPVFTYDQIGVYPVRLKVCKDGFCSAAIHDVTVVEPCTFPGEIVLPETGAQQLDGPVTYEACQTIRTNAPLEVTTQSGEVRFRAGRRIVIGDGFSAGGANRFVAEVDFRLDTP